MEVEMLTSIFNTILLVSAVVGLPSLLIVLWSLMRGTPAEDSPLRRLSQGILMVFGGLFVAGGIIIPVLLPQMVPLRDEQLLRVAPSFARFDFAYASPFSGDMADFEAVPQDDQICLRFRSTLPDRGYGGWLIALWNPFMARFFQAQGYPPQGRDLSSFRVLTFRLRADREDAVLEVALKDTAGREARVVLPRAEEAERITTDFSTFTLDLVEDFRSPEAPPPDLKAIETISFAVNASQIVGARREPPAEGEALSQTVCIQDIELK